MYACVIATDTCVCIFVQQAHTAYVECVLDWRGGEGPESGRELI